MKTLQMSMLTIAIVGLTACGSNVPDWTPDDGDTGWNATGDTGSWNSDTASWDTAGEGPGAPLIAELDWSCNPATGEWNYFARTEGWAGLLTIDIFETGSSVPWDESHDLRNIGWDEDGTWDEWEVNLGGVATPSAVYPGSTTLFTCGYHSDDSLTWMVTSFDGEGRSVDCAVFGQRPSYWIRERGYAECLDWN